MADIKLPFGLKDDIVVHISQVQRGLACGCVCVCCNKPLVARKGPVLVHHFAHSVGAECPKAIETALHLEAKRILADRREIRLPPVEIRLDCGPRAMLLWPETTVALGLYASFKFSISWPPPPTATCESPRKEGTTSARSITSQFSYISHCYWRLDRIRPVW